MFNSIEFGNRTLWTYFYVRIDSIITRVRWL